MAVDDERQLALASYAEAADKLEHAFAERYNMATELDGLVRRVTMSQSISAGVVQGLDISKAQEILGELAKLEQELNEHILAMNENAAKCGKPALKRSDA
jgi:hypothetical protein